MMKQFALIVAAAAVLALGTTLSNPGVKAQVGPSKAQIAAYTGLFAAAQTGNMAEIHKYTSEKIKLNARDAHGRTPLMVATFARHLAAVDALMDAGADSDLLENDKYDALTIAAVDGNTEMVKLLIKKGAKSGLTTSIYDGTALIASAHLGHVGVVKALIAGGAPLDHVNNLNWTALIESIVLGDGGKNHTQVLKDLVEAGANVNIPDGQGRSPLTLAKARGYTQMIAILEKAGAD